MITKVFIQQKFFALKRIFGIALIKFGLLFDWTPFVSWSVYLLIKQKIIISEKDQYLLVLSKDGLDADVEELIQNKINVNFIFINRMFPKAISAKFLPKNASDNNYNDGLTISECEKQRCKEFWKKVCKLLNKKHRVIGIVSGNFGYFAERELAAAACEVGMPFIALHKENLKSKGRVNFFHEVYKTRGAFRGHGITVYNEIEKQLQISSGVAKDNQLFVCGMPRLDKFHSLRRRNGPPKNRPSVLFFGFSQFTGLPRVPLKTGDRRIVEYKYRNQKEAQLQWRQLFTEYYRSLLACCKACPDTDFFLKFKSRPQDYSAALNLIHSLGNPKNLNMVLKGDSFPLVENSNIIVGFNTTGILEGLAAGRKVIVPDFAECENKDYVPFIPSFGEAVVSAKSSEELVGTVVNYVKEKFPTTKLLNKETIKELDVWVGNSDGHSGYRLKQILETAFDL